METTCFLTFLHFQALFLHHWVTLSNLFSSLFYISLGPRCLSSKNVTVLYEHTLLFVLKVRCITKYAPHCFQAILKSVWTAFLAFSLKADTATTWHWRPGSLCAGPRCSTLIQSCFCFINTNVSTEKGQLYPTIIRKIILTLKNFLKGLGITLWQLLAYNTTIS